MHLISLTIIVSWVLSSFLLAKRQHRLRGRRNGCFRRLVSLYYHSFSFAFLLAPKCMRCHNFRSTPNFTLLKRIVIDLPTDTTRWHQTFVSSLSLLIFIFVPLLLNLVKIKIKCCSLFTDCSLVLKFIQVYCDWIDWITICGKKSGNTVAMRYTCKNSIILSFKSCDCLIYDLGDCYFIIKFLRRYVFLWGHLLTHFTHFNTFRFKPTRLEL